MITKFNIFENFAFQLDSEKSQAGVKVLHILAQLQIFHWQTPKMSVHKTVDEYIDKFKENADKLLEVIQGKYGRIVIGENTYIPIRNIDDIDPYTFANQCIDVFEMYKNNIFLNDAEIITIIDEIITDLQQLKYLLSFGG